MSTKYDNTDWSRLSRTGGAVVVTLVATPRVGMGFGVGNDGISLPCKGCWVAGRTGQDSFFMAAHPLCSPLVSPDIAKPENGGQPFWIPVSDVSQLSFCGATGSKIDIVYLLG